MVVSELGLKVASSKCPIAASSESLTIMLFF